jgi:hypothetical protein
MSAEGSKRKRIQHLESEDPGSDPISTLIPLFEK